MATAMSGMGARLVPRGPWVTMGIVAVVAVAAGLLVPQLLPGEMAIEKNQPRSEAKGKSKGEYIAPALPDMPNPQGMLTRLAFGTLVVLGLSVVSIWAMRRWLQPPGSAVAGPRTLRLLETLPLGNRCSVHLVHMGNREVLIGVDGSGIKSIVPLPENFADVLTQTEPGAVNREQV